MRYWSAILMLAVGTAGAVWSFRRLVEACRPPRWPGARVPNQAVLHRKLMAKTLSSLERN